MDRNSYIGLGLIFALLIGYFYINQPSAQDLAMQKRAADTIQTIKILETKKGKVSKVAPVVEVKKEVKKEVTRKTK